MQWKNWMIQRNPFFIIGLAGVHQHEPKRARVWGRLFTLMIIFVAILMLLQWQLSAVGHIQSHAQLVINWVVWFFFVFEYILLFSLVKKKWRFVYQNWLLPIIILLGLPLILDYSALVVVLRMARPFLALLLMIPSLGLLLTFFVDGRLLTTLFAAFIIVVVFGILVAGLDPNITSVWDGIWWALATVSTVGYGDVVPSDFWGRVLGGILVIIGLGIFVVITANFLALTLRKETRRFREEEQDVAEILQDMQVLKEEQQETLLLLKSLSHRLDKLARK